MAGNSGKMSTEEPIGFTNIYSYDTIKVRALCPMCKTLLFYVFAFIVDEDEVPLLLPCAGEWKCRKCLTVVVEPKFSLPGE